MNQPAVNTSPEVVEKMARKLEANGYAKDAHGAELLAEYLKHDSYNVLQAIEAAPSTPAAEAWLRDQIELARKQFRASNAGPGRAQGRDRSHLSPVPGNSQGNQRPAPRPAQEQGRREPPPGAERREPSRSQYQGRPQGGAPAPQPRNDGGNERVIRKEGYDQIHVYAKKAALTFEASETRLKDNGQGGLPTVTVDAAPAGSAPRSYVWADKVRFQITASELHFVSAVLMGWAEGVEFANHGQNNDKGLSIQNQDNGLYIRVWAKGANNPVPVFWQDFGALNALVLRQLEALTGLHGAALMAHIRACARFCPKPRANNRPQQSAQGGRP